MCIKINDSNNSKNKKNKQTNILYDEGNIIINQRLI